MSLESFKPLHGAGESKPADTCSLKKNTDLQKEESNMLPDVQHVISGFFIHVLVVTGKKEA